MCLFPAIDDRVVSQHIHSPLVYLGHSLCVAPVDAARPTVSPCFFFSQILWSDYLTPHFHIFIALSILVTYRDSLLSGHLSENDILEVCETSLL